RNFAVYEGIAGSISFKVTVSVLKNHESKYVTVNLTNLSSSRVEISLSYYTEPCLGTDRKNNGCVKFSRTSFGISFKNPFNSGFKCIAELSSDRVPDSIVTDKFSFLCGDWSMSDLIPKKHCCAAVVNNIVLDGDSSDSVSYFLTCSENGESVTDLTLEKFTVQNRIRINSSDEYLNILFNYWLPLQIKNDRMLARTGFYQSSGAYGFRDQLQDSKALLLIDPAICRNHIIKCCSRQFFEGDVLHWWHEYDGAVKGVRTRCSDDKLWLADAVYDYVEKTGDAEILEIKVPYISGERLEENEIEKYEVCLIDESRCESVYEHVLKAVKSVSFGSHNLALIGSCDWNDGFSNVGVKGIGESVWLSMFLADIYRKTAVLAEIMNDPVNYGKFTERSDELKRYIDESCWDGEWYIRAFHDNGETVGSSNDDSCKIDLLPQAFATICDMPDTQRKESALDSCIKYLYDEKIGIVKLFSPPYSDTSKIGYVGAYPEGIRENGGQYTHAAVWFDIALFKAKRAEEGYKILRLLNPAFRSAEKPFSQVFLTEPYSMPADIYDNISCRGRGGWTHYTGAAGWMYKCIFENLYGISVLNDRMAVNPCFPKGFTPGNIEIEIKNTKINVDFVYSETVDCGDTSMLIVDGAVSDFIPIDGKRHFATVKFKNNIE
ncbi:MAG: GH36-type glycosyl hydrolase domain-containing protein, partial [Acutalibacteraceae bacterium]